MKRSRLTERPKSPATTPAPTPHQTAQLSSNVDLAAQFVNLIVAQRAFQANTRTVSVDNELLANLVALGQ